MSGVDLLGGAERTKPRVRGFAPWRPQRDTLALLELVRAVLAEYAQYLPLTLRQIFYRLVGAHGYSKTELAYERLGEHLTRARRAKLIPMDAIRDDGGVRHHNPGWSSKESFLASVAREAEGFRLDRQIDQPVALMILCEAAGMAPQLARVASDYDIPVVSSGGFESVTEQHRLGMDIAAEHRPVAILHIGDHDPSGAHLFLALEENVAAFAEDLGGEVTFSRLAVIPQQIAELGLPTAPPKAGDRRAFHGETCQAEAIPPDVLADIVRDAILSRLDHDAYRAVLQQEQDDRQHLVELLRGVGR